MTINEALKLQNEGKSVAIFDGMVCGITKKCGFCGEHDGELNIQFCKYDEVEKCSTCCGKCGYNHFGNCEW